MVTEAISSGFTSLNLFPKSEYPDVALPTPPLVAVLSIATPSITIKALLLPVSEPAPLNTILVEAPTEPEAVLYKEEVTTKADNAKNEIVVDSTVTK